jgi:nitrite reductase/ring-hydroxylating ferredoxin subunit/uncharacterized membrane protein
VAPMRPRAHEISKAIAGMEVLDAPAKAIVGKVYELLPAGPVKDVISGVPIGHALHPLLTDVPIGTWTSATILDLIGGESSRSASEALIGVGVLAAVPTAVSGFSDWADSEYGHDDIRRIGMAHAVANVGALVLYSASLYARRRGAQGTGVALGLAGAAALSAGGWLGGDLAYAHGLGVDQTVFHPEPSDWTPVLDASMLVDDRPTAATAGDTPIMVVRRNGTLHALADRCTHRGGPLSEGELVGDCVQCPWHQSQFRLDDGSVEQGPATFPQPVLDVREQDGRIEVKAR